MNSNTEFGASLRAILALPAARNKQRQALAIAAESTVSPEQAAHILAALPEDNAAGFPHGGTIFDGSTVQHDAEAQRIMAIMRCPEAEGREAAALELATGTAMSVANAQTLLARMPKIERRRTASIAERAAAEREFGTTLEEMPVRGGAGGVWGRAVAKANRAVAQGAAASPTASTPNPPQMERRP